MMCIQADLRRGGLRLLFLTILVVSSGLRLVQAGSGVLEMRNGYFWDPQAGDYFLPRGIAYQVWNPPVGANQSFDQVDYDLLEFKKMYANSVRCEFVWSQVQTGSNTWNWAKPDHLVAEAEKLGLKLFVIIGFQYPPPWFPAEWRNINEQGMTPDVLDCFAASNSATVTNCLPRAIYDHLYTNNLPPEVLATTLHCLTSSAPADVIGCLQQNLPLDYQTGLTNIISYFVSDVVNYEHPEARRAYTNHIAKVVDRYKNSPAIGAWIMGNECAYFDLWEDANIYKIHRFIGYDSFSQAAFRNYLKTLYNGDISTLNTNWRTNYQSFDAVQMPRAFPAERNQPAFTDLIHWRQQSIGGFIASGAHVARSMDPNHLMTYSMVGGIFNGNDGNNTCEDAPSIVAACKAAGAPLNFWSINSYAWASHGSELRTADFGISKYQQLLDLPVMISETGHSSTENLFDGAQPRQAKALPGQVWESVMSGAIGTHIFHWNDRNQFTQGYFDREKGFGIVNEDRTVKVPVYFNVLDMFRRMRDIRVENLLGGSSNPPPDIQYFWSKAADLTWPSANQENTMLWGALRRLGFQLGIIDDAKFQRQAYTNAPVLLLSRCWQMSPTDLDTIANDVVGAGIHVHANTDLPGQVDAYLNANPKWLATMSALFGLDATKAVAAYDEDAVTDHTTNLGLFGATTFGPITPNFAAEFATWKIWHGLRSVSGTTILTDTGVGGSQNNPRLPAVQIKTLARAKTALNSFGLANTFVRQPQGTNDPAQLYDFRYDILRAVYRDHFGLMPIIDISGPGEKHIVSDYRVCRNGSVLVSLLNVETSSAEITVSAPQLWRGKVVENITSGGIVSPSSDGTLNFTLAGDDYVLLYAYDRGNGVDNSLINPSPEKLWFKSAPLAVWPTGKPSSVEIGYDLSTPGSRLLLSLEQVQPVERVLAQSDFAAIQGQGTNSLAVTVPDADLNDPNYLSSADGGQYVFRAKLERNGTFISSTALPVRLLWSVKPTAPLPTIVSAGKTYQIPLEWQELPSYVPGDTMPMDRALLWQSLEANSLHYNVTLELLDAAGRIVASDEGVTARGSGNDLFTINVPASASGPFTWTALAQAAPNTVSVDVDDSFEGRNRGEDRAQFYPWFGYRYPEINSVVLLEQGITNIGTGGNPNLVAYMTVQNPPNPGPFSGFGLVEGRDEWALPTDRKQWSHYSFSFDFKEVSQLPCELEMQVKDTSRNWISFVKSYAPGPNGWDTIQASLADFGPGDSPGAFDPAHVHDWVMNVRMLQTNTIYRAFFDNAHFVGPPNLDDTFEDRHTGFYEVHIAPWQGYGYDQPGSLDIKLNEGVGLDERTDGSQAAFMVAWYKPNSGTFAGFGMTYPFAQTWSLPTDKSQWQNYTFSYDFKERFAQPCILELQLKSPNTVDAGGHTLQHAIHFTKAYVAGSNNWDTISASLDQFTELTDFPFAPFDPQNVNALVLNVQMLQSQPSTNVIYVGWFDHIQFHGPATLGPSGATYGLFSSANDSFRITSITEMADETLSISWAGGGALEMADKIAGSWTSAGANTSPAKVPMGGAARFYRVKR